MSEPTHFNNSNAELVRRAERRKAVLDAIAEHQDELKLLKAEDKQDGFSEKALAQVVKEIRRGAEYSEAQLTLELELTTYRKAVGLPVTLEDAQRLVHEEATAVPDLEIERERDDDGRFAGRPTKSDARAMLRKVKGEPVQ